MSNRDLDQSGHGYQRVRTYLGPSLGWVDELVQPATEIKIGGAYNVQPGDSLILVDVAAGVTINLPDVIQWVQQNANQPATAFERSITVKDIGGNAANFNIVVVPFGQQAIDNIQQSVIISQARAILKFIPLVESFGWAVEIASATGGGGGSGDVLKAGNNTFTGINTFNNTITVPTLPASNNTQNAASTAYVQSQGYITGAALTPYALLASPTFTDDPKAPTPSPGDNDTSIATTAFVQAAIGAVGTPAPVNAEYITSSANATLTAERVLTNTASITWDFSTPGQAKASTAAGGGNVSSSGTPVALQYGRWVTATTIEGVSPATVRSDIGAQPLDAELTAIAGLPSSADTLPYFNGVGTAALTNFTPAARTVVSGTTVGAMLTTLGGQPLDADLTAISALAGTNTIYYRSAPDIWSPVTFSGLSFSGGVLTVTAGGGNVNSSGTPTVGQYGKWVTATTIQGVAAATVLSDIGAAPVGAQYITSTADPTLTAERVLTDTSTVTWDRTTAGQIKANAVGGGASAPGGRLSLVSAQPVMVSSQVGKTSIYYTPYNSDQIPLYDGTAIMLSTTFAELVALTTDTTKSPAAIGPSKVNDWYVWNDAGTIRLIHGLDWTSDTARHANGVMAQIKGVWLNAFAITNGPAALRGTYVGTTRSNASSQLDWIYGDIAAGGTAGFFGVWNAYNRRPVFSTSRDNTDSWTWTGATWRAPNGSANMRTSFVIGLQEDPIVAIYTSMGSLLNADLSSGIGFDTTNAASGVIGFCYASANVVVSPIGRFGTIPAIGFHYVSALEMVTTATSTIYGDAGGVSQQSGLTTSLFM